jgi:peptidoglycan/xylan/chitin deacetylase (PgdA/CDA1 family)
MYHRIADDRIDPWGLAVSPAHFEEHLQALLRGRHPMPLTKFVSRYTAGTLPAHAVAITFDDGYADNLYAAKPRLAAADVPATVFLVTGYLDHVHEFWWDELARLIIVGAGPETLTLLIDGQVRNFGCGTVPPASGARQESGWSTPIATRQKAYMEILQAMRPLQDGKRAALMAKLRAVFHRRDLLTTRGRAMTRDEVRTLAIDGLMTIGAHSVTHPALTGLGDFDRRHEIEESKKACEALVEYQVSAFAYPYGDFDRQVCAAVRGTKFDCACSANHGAVVADCDVFALPRIHVRDWDGNEFDQKLRI